MIYITNEYSELQDVTHISNVWEVDSDNVEELYKEFMIAKASEINAVINEHWLNLMNRKDHHPNLSSVEYKSLEKKWDKLLAYYTIDRFILEEMKGRRLDYININ